MSMFIHESNHEKGATTMIHPIPHHGPHHPYHEKPIAPHLKHVRLALPFPEDSYQILYKVFGDEDVANSAMDILTHAAPPEIQVLALQAMEVISRMPDAAPDDAVSDQDAVVSQTDDARENRARWTNPVLDESTTQMFTQLYGENGSGFLQALGTAPYEIAIVSRMMAYLNEKGGVLNNGCH